MPFKVVYKKTHIEASHLSFETQREAKSYSWKQRLNKVTEIVWREKQDEAN